MNNTTGQHCTARLHCTRDVYGIALVNSSIHQPGCNCVLARDPRHIFNAGPLSPVGNSIGEGTSGNSVRGNCASYSERKYVGLYFLSFVSHPVCFLCVYKKWKYILVLGKTSTDLQVARGNVKFSVSGK